MSKLGRDEKGLGQVVIIIIVVVVLAVAGVAIWQLTKKKTNTNNTTTTSSTSTSSNASVSSACLKTFKDNTLCAFALHTNISSQQYVATGTATSASGTTSTFTVKNDGKGNTEVTSSSNGQSGSYISLDGSTYVQAGSTGTWLEYSGSSLGAATTVPNPVSGFNLNFTNTTTAGVSVTNQGTVACGSSTCYKYKVVVASTPTTTEYVYFDKSSYLLKQWTSNDTSTGVSVNVTFSYEPVTISKPSPVQQVNI